MRPIEPSPETLDQCPGCGAHHAPATLGDGRRAWCDGSAPAAPTAERPDRPCDPSCARRAHGTAECDCTRAGIEPERAAAFSLGARTGAALLAAAHWQAAHRSARAAMLAEYSAGVERSSTNLVGRAGLRHAADLALARAWASAGRTDPAPRLMPDGTWRPPLPEWARGPSAEGGAS